MDISGSGPIGIHLPKKQAGPYHWSRVKHTTKLFLISGGLPSADPLTECGSGEPLSTLKAAFCWETTIWSRLDTGAEPGLLDSGPFQQDQILF